MTPTGQKILVTGCAGFIGFHLSKKLLDQENLVFGIDNLSAYYDVCLKENRLNYLKKYKNFSFAKCNISNKEDLHCIFTKHNFDCVVNLAAQPGVRYSLENPYLYIDSNVVGFCNILENCRHFEIENLVFASSSSVYGANTKKPLKEHASTEHPLSLYAASKKANEMMAHTYASQFNLSCTGLRFFTVYGPWGRPDMAIFKFTKQIINGEPIEVYNNGSMMRDFTYIDDVITAILFVIDHPAEKNPNWNGGLPDPATSFASYRIYNVGNGKPVSLLEFISAIESQLGKKAVMKFFPMQPGEVVETYADVSGMQKTFGFRPRTNIQEGVGYFVDWYKQYHQIK